MKLIDSKGKLFGKLNLIDLIVIVIIIIVVVVVGLKMTGDDGAVTGHKVGLEYTVLVEEVPKELYEEVKVHLPSKLMASGATLDGQVVSVEQQPCMIPVTDDEGAIRWVEDQEKTDLLFTVEANVTKSGGALTSEVGTQEVRVGKNHIVKTEYIELTGTVLSAEWDLGQDAAE